MPSAPSAANDVFLLPFPPSVTSNGLKRLLLEPAFLEPLQKPLSLGIVPPNGIQRGRPPCPYPSCLGSHRPLVLSPSTSEVGAVFIPAISVPAIPGARRCSTPMPYQSTARRRLPHLSPHPSGETPALSTLHHFLSLCRVVIPQSFVTFPQKSSRHLF